MINPKILIVSNNSLNIHTISDILQPSNYQIAHANNVKAAATKIRAHRFSLVIFDIEIDGNTDSELSNTFANDAKAKNIPFIALIIERNESLITKAFSYGAIDYFCQPLVKAEILPKVHNYIMLYSALENSKRVNNEQEVTNNQLLLNEPQPLNNQFNSLLENYEKFKIVAEKLQQVLWLWSASNFLYVNPAYESLFEKPCAELYQNPDLFFSNIVADDLNKVRKGFELLHIYDTDFNEEYRIKLPDGQVRWIWARAFAFSVGDIKLQLGIAEDISKLKQYELDLIEAKNAAEQASIAKSAFIANMSHEIRTPLNAVIGFSDLLYQQLTEPIVRNYLSSIKTSANTLLTIINDILDISKIEAGRMPLKLDAVDLRLVINEIRGIYEQTIAQKKLNFIVDIPDSFIYPVLLDEQKIRQILLNLISNAVKFTESGFIKLTVNDIISGQSASGEKNIDLHISVEDTGIGIAPENQMLIFDAFNIKMSNDHRKYHGTGLGLAIATRFAEMMNGSISVQSIENKGSIFSVAFKNVTITNTVLPEIAARQDYENLIFDNALVLIADDMEVNRQLLRSLLTGKNLRTIEAGDGRTALHLAKEHHPALIMMDIQMPTMDGHKAIRLLRSYKELKTTPVIAITATALNEMQQAYNSSGFDGFVNKPINNKKLYMVLTKFLKHSFPDQTTITPDKSPSNATKSVEGSELQTKLAQFELAFMKQWQTVCKTNTFNEIADFAGNVTQFGISENVALIQKYGIELTELCTCFDLEKIEIYLQNFNQLIDTLKVKD